MRLTARAPATSANLGPGFDCFGLALDLCNEVTIDTEAAPGVTWEGEGADELATDGSDLVSRAIVYVAEMRHEALSGYALHGVNRIPIERGLGSSAAAATAGVALGWRLLEVVHGQPDPYVVWPLASDLEGHPDNAAACAYGGLTLAVPGVGVTRLDPHPDLRAAVLVPSDARLSTEAARHALRPQVSREDAVFNLQRAALAVVGLTLEPSLLPAALEDRLHQDARLSLVPEVREVFELVREAGVPVCVSGSGPSLLAFERRDVTVPELDDGWRVLRVPVRPSGVEIVEG